MKYIITIVNVKTFELKCYITDHDDEINDYESLLEDDERMYSNELNEEQEKKMKKSIWEMSDKEYSKYYKDSFKGKCKYCGGAGTVLEAGMFSERYKCPLCNGTGMKSNLWYVYIVQCRDGTLYTGITTDIARRIYEHNNLKCGARYTRTRRLVKLVYNENFTTRSEAMKREYEIKHLSQIDKFKLFDL
jgi:putative endonuclease